jgi:uncharacterized protein YbjT (DUF2867 family)
MVTVKVPAQAKGVYGMKVILFGGTGMVGQGVLRECLADARVEQVLLVVRKATGAVHAKVEDLVQEDFFDWTSVAPRFEGYDKCLFCLGVSAVGMQEEPYRRTTYDLTLGVAEVLLKQGVKSFLYVSGQGTDEQGRSMWARVKGETESALMRLPFAQVYCFRPGYIQPMHGVRSKIGWYNGIYAVLSWTYPLLRRVAGRFVTSTEEVGRAMVNVAAEGYPKAVLETLDIHAAAGGG